MLLRYGLVTAAALSLCGCHFFSASTNTDVAALRFDCSDGRRIMVVYPNPDTALLTMKAHSYELHLTTSADGARYVGGGWQWWTKGMHDGALSLLSAHETIASERGVECHSG